MTTYQSQTVHTEDREGNSLAFSTVNLDGEEAVLKAAVAVELPDGQQVSMNVLYDSEDVRGLMAYLHDNFGGRTKTTVKAEDLQDPGGWPAATEPQPATGAGWSAASPEDLQYYAEQDTVWQPKPGDKVHVVTATVTDHQTGTVVPSEPEGRQCPVTYSGVQCNGREGHGHEHNFSPLPTYGQPQNDAGAVPPPADAQGAANTPQSGAGTPDQSAAESATGAGNTGTAPASTSEKPKRPRRKKEEKAYDDALEAYSANQNNETWAPLAEAYEALKKRLPDNPRIGAGAALGLSGPQEASGFHPQTGPAFAPDPTADYQAAGQVLIDAANSAGHNVPSFGAEQPQLGTYVSDSRANIPADVATGNHPAGGFFASKDGKVGVGGTPEEAYRNLVGEVSPEEQQAATGFPCPVQSSDGRPCLRPYGHELQTATNPQPKPHVYATVPSQLPTTPLVESPLTGPSYPAPGQQEGNQAFLAGQPLSFQVPPTPQATAPHPETNLQPPAPAAPSWAEPV